MNEIKINKFQSIYYITWNNNDNTIELITEYLKATKGDNWSCGRCQGNSNDVLYISKKEGDFKSSSFHMNGEYIVDFGKIFSSFSVDEFEEEEIINTWLKINR